MNIYFYLSQRLHMNENSRIFDFLQYQLDKFPKDDMLCGKENGEWKPYSTAEVQSHR